MSQKKIKRVIGELAFVDIDEVYSESDASEHRAEEIHIELDNKISSQIKTSFAPTEEAKKTVVDSIIFKKSQTLSRDSRLELIKD